MSRRKQAKPRALKREDLQSAAAFEEESTQDTLSFENSTKESGCRSPPTPIEHCEISSTVSDGHESPDEDAEDEDEESSHFCDACKMGFDSVSEYLDHVSQDCLNGGGSARSSDDLSPSPGAGTPSSSGSGADPDSELSFSVGVTEANPYGCQFCDKAFPRLSYLKRHEQIHSEQMPFRCDYCHRLFKHKRSRDRHVKLHTGDRKYRCAQCESAFSRSDHLKIHMRTHDNGKPYQCAVCNRGYNTAAALSSHMQNHKHKSEQTDSKEEDEKPLRCSPQVCASPLQQRPFSSPLSESPRPPSSARMGMDSPNALLNKKMEPGEGPHQPLPLTCGFCSRSDFPSLESLQLHVQALHVPGPDPALAASISSLHNMLLRRTDGLLGGDFSLFLQKPPAELLSKREETYCSQCSTTFPNTTALLDHVRVAHAPPTPPTNNHSNKRSLSSSLSRLRPNGAKHLKTSNLHPTLIFNGSSSHYRRQDPGGGSGQDNTLLCNQCTAAFPDFESFRTHLRSHLSGGGGTGRCPQCGAAFSSEPALLSHLCGHLLTAEWGCPACGRAFAKAEELQGHLLEAHACRLYRCGLCAQIFDSKVSIQVHLAVKHSSAEQRTLKCSSCLASFRSELDFQLHVKVQHLEPRFEPFQPQEAPSSAEEEAQDLCTKKQSEGSAAKASSTSDVQQPSSSTDATPAAASTTSTSSPPPPAHRCDACEATFSSEALLLSHRLHSHGGGGDKQQQPQQKAVRSVSLQCAYCGEACRTRAELEAHTKTHTASPARHKCNICDEMCPSAATLAEHKLTHCKVVSGSTCTSCRAHLSTESQFLQHLRQHCASLPAPCPVCRQTLAADVEARSHARFHLRRHPCLVCGDSFEHTLLVPRGAAAFMCKACFHAKGTAPATTAPCANCSSFLCKGGCDSRCADCGVKFESRSELESHRRTVHQKRTFQCIKCQLEFATEREIQNHVAGHVLQEGTNHECRLCHEVLDSPSRLQCHLIEHTFAGCAHFTCYLCAAVFTGSAPLQRHMVAEHGLDARPYDCSECGQRFFFRAELDNHALAVHGWPDSAPSTKTGGILECAQCPSVFVSPLDLVQHRIHQHEGGLPLTRPPECDDPRAPRPFPTVCPKDMYSFEEDREEKGSFKKERKCIECHVCKKRFTRKENRRLHMKTHHNADARPAQFPCSLCSKVFTKKAQLKEHVRSSHRGASSTAQPSTTASCPVCGEGFDSHPQLEEHLEQRHRPTVEEQSPPSPPPPPDKSDPLQEQEDLEEDENDDKDLKEPEKEGESQTETDMTSSDPETLELSCISEDRTNHPPEVVA